VGRTTAAPVGKEARGLRRIHIKTKHQLPQRIQTRERIHGWFTLLGRNQRRKRNPLRNRTSLLTLRWFYL